MLMWHDIWNRIDSQTPFCSLNFHLFVFPISNRCGWWRLQLWDQTISSTFEKAHSFGRLFQWEPGQAVLKSWKLAVAKLYWVQYPSWCLRYLTENSSVKSFEGCDQFSSYDARAERAKRFHCVHVVYGQILFINKNASGKSGNFLLQAEVFFICFT